MPPFWVKVLQSRVLCQVQLQQVYCLEPVVCFAEVEDVHCVLLLLLLLPISVGLLPLQFLFSIFPFCQHIPVFGLLHLTTLWQRVGHSHLWFHLASFGNRIRHSHLCYFG